MDPGGHPSQFSDFLSIIKLNNQKGLQTYLKTNSTQSIRNWHKSSWEVKEAFLEMMSNFIHFPRQEFIYENMKNF